MMLDVEQEVAIRYRPATLGDELLVITALSKVLRALEPLGHDILPTEFNIATLWEFMIEPALRDKHGIYLAFTEEGECVGCSLAVPEVTPLQIGNKRAITLGVWVEPEYRRRGIALRLQMHSHGALANHGFDEIVSNVLEANEAGLASVQAAGASIIGYITKVDLKGAKHG